MEWLFLLLSIPIGVLAARVDVLISWGMNRVRYGPLQIRGNWAEWVPGSIGRQFSVGSIQYNVFRRQYSFDGTNYNNNGDPYCHWKTVTSYVDYDKQEFHYVFATKDVATMQTTSYGYGVVNLVSRGGVLAPEDGYYIYATPDGSALSLSHTMVSVSSIPARRTSNARDFLSAELPDHLDALE